MGFPRANQFDRSAGDCRGHSIGSRLDSVGNDCVAGRVQGVDPLHPQRIGACPLDLGAHGDQAVGQIDDFGLARCVQNDGFTLGQSRRHQGILGGADRNLSKSDLAAAQSARDLCLDKAAGDIDFGAQVLHGRQMQVDRSVAYGTAAGQRHPCLSRPREQRAQHQDRRPHLAHQVIWRSRAGQVAAAHAHDPLAAFTAQLYIDAMLPQQLRHRGDVGQTRNIGQIQGLPR